MSQIVTDNIERSRFELHIDGELAAFEDYTLEPGVISFNHTESLPAFAGQGVARMLVEEILAEARRRGLSVLPYCGYVAGIIRKNPDAYLDLVPADRRADFNLPA